MRRALLAAMLLAAAADAAGAQRSDRRGDGCRECAQDSLSRMRRRPRLSHSDQIERISRMGHELNAARRKLEHEQDLSDGERRRLERRIARLQDQLTQLGMQFGMQFGLEAAERALRDVHPTLEKALREMQPALAEAQGAMASAAAEAALAPGAAAGPMRFAGWIGITLDAPSTVQVRGGDVYLRFLHHPQVVSVDPSSPAARSGIRQGDVLLAYDGQDVRREIAMNRLLRPGRLVQVRVRDGNNKEVRDVPVTIAPAREFALREWAPGAVVVAPRVKPKPWPVEDARRAPPPAPASPASPPPPIDRPARESWPVISFLPAGSGLAGARVETITRGLGEAIGVERGVLVISVAAGVPAQEAGLLDGDVILKADGRDVRSVRELSAVVSRADDRTVRLDVVRRGKTRQVTLRW